MAGVASLASSATEAEPKAVGFEVLASFPYVLPDPVAPGALEKAKAGQIPAQVAALNGARAVVSGFMVPVNFSEGRVRQFILVRNQLSCCFGVTPAMNEFVLVTMGGDGVPPLLDAPVSVLGTLKVGETYEDGLLVGIYQLAGESLVPNKT